MRGKRFLALALTAVILAAVPGTMSQAGENDWSPLLSLDYGGWEGIETAIESKTWNMRIDGEVNLALAEQEDEQRTVRTRNALLYAENVYLNEKIPLIEEELDSKKDELTRTKALFQTGEASKEDVDTLKEEVSDLEDELESAREDLERNTPELNEAMAEAEEGTGWESFILDVDSTIWYDQLDKIEDYAASQDAGFVRADKEAREALWKAWADYTARIAAGQAALDDVFEYIITIASGEEIDTSALRDDYDIYLGMYGLTEDYNADSLYDAILEYQDKASARNEAEEELSDGVEAAYDTLVEAMNEYISVNEKISGSQRELKLNRVRYRLGEKTREEYEAEIEKYGSYDRELADARYEFYKALYETDEITAGALSSIVENVDWAEDEEAEDLYGEDEDAGGDESEEAGNPDSGNTEDLSIVYVIQAFPFDGQFSVGVTLPEGYEEDITEFELWCGGTQAGIRTGIFQVIRTGVISESRISEVVLKFFRDGTEIGECEIDPTVPVGSADLTIDTD